MPAPLQTISAEGSSDPLTMTFPSALTSGSVIAVAVMIPGTGGVPTPTGGGVTTFAADVVKVLGNSVTIFSGVTDGSSAVVSLATGFGYHYMAAIEMPSGVTLDATASDNNQGPNSSTGTTTPTASADVLLFGATCQGANTTSGPTNSFTIIGGGATKGVSMYRNVASATGSYSSGMGTGNNYATWAGALAVYKAASSATSPPNPARPQTIAVMRASNY